MLEVPYYELDNMIWDRSVENRRFPQEIRDAELHRIVSLESWIIEGVQFEWTSESFEEADLIYILNPSVYLRDYRIIRRFVRSRTGIERWNYKQSVKNLMKMLIEWNHGYNLEEVLEITKPYSGKRFEVTSTKEVLRHVQESLK